ncbi:GEVED domain-containing protein [Carboxylicivirga taeanensis]|uniref:GEVED domain-containing protein n=1 Tax=Carboxylicivirga taeanensis TaxID=1416875 RepID=UPI003F6E188C
MKKLLLLITCSLLLISCNVTSKKELFFLQKNAYDYPVWEEMLQQDKVMFSDVVLAFNAYASNHELDTETLEHFEKLEKRITGALDSDGYYINECGQYKNLLAFRNPVPGNEEPLLKSGSMPTSYTKEIPNNGNLGQWKNIGPFGDPDVHWSATGNGAVQYIEMHPSNPAIMFACTRNGGLWKTVNYGKNWTPETDHFATNNTSCIEVCPANASILYLGTAEDEKIYYSHDFGINWEDRSSGIEGKIFDVHSDPNNAARAIAATASGIYLTTNSGLSWTQKLRGRYTDIDLTDNWDLIVVSCDDADIAPVFNFSNDKGDTFIERSIITHRQEVDRFYLGIYKPVIGSTLVYAYGIVDGNMPTRFIGLWKSEYNPTPNDGKSYFNFTQVKHPTYSYPNGPVPLEEADNADGFKAETEDYYGSVNPYSTATWISDFYISPNNSSRLLLLREKFWGSEDGGIIWGLKPSYGKCTWADNRYVTTNTTKDTVFWCNDGGIWAIKEDDLFPTEATVSASGMSKLNYICSKVVSKNGDICIAEGSQMDVSLLNKGVFITGGQDIGQIFTRNGRTSHVASADVYRGRIKSEDDTKFITGGLVVKLNDGGTDDFFVYNSIEPDHFDNKRLYGFTRNNRTQGTKDVRLVRSPYGQDGWLVNSFKGENVPHITGHAWTPIYNNWTTVPTLSAGISELHAGTFEQSRANGELAFLGDEVGLRLFYTENLSADAPEWIHLKNAPQASRYRIATHQYNENIIALATDAGVYISKDKGETWNLRGIFPENNPMAILIDKNTSEGIYVMTSLTVYYIDETLTEWQEFNQGLPLQSLTDMRIAYYPNNDSRLYVSKYGRGVWFSSLQSALNDNVGMPVVDFTIHGGSADVINVGETVTLLDQSSNANGLQWTLENGSDVIRISDESSPSVTLTTPGYYKVTLTATNANGTSVLTKDQYITVKTASSVSPMCAPNYEYDLVWYKGIKKLSVNGDTYDAPSRANYFKADKVFEVNAEDQISLYCQDNYNPGYNFYTKVWIDFNNDGDFDDADEEVANSNGKVDNFTGNFTIPATAILNEPLLMRVAALEDNTPPAPCNDIGTGQRQTIDFKIKILGSNISFSNVSHNNLSYNKIDLSASYSGADNVKEVGFIYAAIDGDLNIDNANVVALESPAVFGNSDTYTNTLTDLDYNVAYYYRPFIRDVNGIHYGEKKSLSPVLYNIPLAECLMVEELGSGQWKLKGLVFPENNTLDELSIEYGNGDFSTKVDFDPSSYAESTDFVIHTTLTTSLLGAKYQYRIKLGVNGKTYYSNIQTFVVTNISTDIGELSNSDSPYAISLYPNPVMDELYVSVADVSGKEFIIEILNSTGKIVEKYKRTFSLEPQSIDIRKLTSGLYFIRLSDRKTTVTSKFIKQ